MVVPLFCNVCILPPPPAKNEHLKSRVLKFCRKREDISLHDTSRAAVAQCLFHGESSEHGNPMLPSLVRKI